MADPGGVPVIVSGGGTGGHLYPALTLGRALARVQPRIRPVYVGARRGLEARILPDTEMEHHLLDVRGFRRGSVLGNWRVVPSLVGSLARAVLLFRRLDPALVVCTGGYASGPAGLAAALLGIPLVLQEQNSVPGVTTRLLSRWARQIHVAFPETAERLPAGVRPRIRVSGNPVEAPRDIDRDEARAAFDLPPGGTVVLVVGGSQGAAPLNRAVLEAIRGVESGDLPALDQVSILWSTGPAHRERVEAELAALGGPAWVRPVGYIRDMTSALAASDLAVSRAGAMATAELLAWNLPALLVPLPSAAENHQLRNARALEAEGVARVLEEGELTGPALWSTLREILVSDVEEDGFRARARRRLAQRNPPPTPLDYARRILDGFPELATDVAGTADA